MMSCYAFGGREIGGGGGGGKVAWDQAPLAEMAENGVKQHKKSSTKRAERWS